MLRLRLLLAAISLLELRSKIHPNTFLVLLWDLTRTKVSTILRIQTFWSTEFVIACLGIHSRRPLRISYTLQNSFLLHISGLYVSAFFLEVAESQVCVWYSAYIIMQYTSSLYVLLLLQWRDESIYEWWYSA